MSNTIRLALIETARALAQRLELAAPTETAIVRTVDEILGQDGRYAAYQSGIITSDEFAKLVLAYFQTLICNEAGVPEPTTAPETGDLEKEILALIEHA